MPELLSPTTPTRATPADELTLRLCGTPQDGRLVRLRGAKCTIGADSQCTLRLRATGVQPFHCVILRGAERTIVRSLSGVTRLNRHEISESILSLGDRLTIGAVEFEVAAGVGEASRAAATIGDRWAESCGAATEPAPNAGTGQRANDAGDENARHNRARARRLLSRLREARRESELVGLRLGRLEETNAGLNQNLAELDTVRQRLAAIEAQSSVEAQSHAEQRALIEEQLCALERDRSANEQARAALEQERQGLLDERRAFDEERRALDEQRRALDDDRHAFEQQRSIAASVESQDQAAQRTELEERLRLLEQERSAIEQTRAGLEEARGELLEERRVFDDEKRMLDEERRSVDEARRAIEQQRSELEQEKNQLSQERSEAESQRSLLEQERATLQGERTAVEAKQLLLAQELKEFEEHKHVLTLERLDWQTEASRAAADIAARREELDRRSVAIEKHAAEHDAARRRFEESQKAIAKRQEALAQAENELLAKTRQAQEQAAELESQRQALAQEQQRLAVQQQALADMQAAVEGERRTVDDLCLQDRSSQDELGRDLADKARQLNDASERLNSVTRDLAHQQTLVEAMRSEQDAERQRWEAERVKLQAEFERRSAARAQPSGEPASPHEGPADQRCFTADALAPNAEAAAIESNARVSGSPAPSVPAAVAKEASADDYSSRDESSAVAETDAVSGEVTRHSSGASADGEEESIDDYMTRLLKRVQSIGQRHRPAAISSATSPASESAPATTSPEDAAAEQPAAESAPVMEVLTKLSRRATAPELSSDIAAMRELANLSARAAIDKHAYRNWGRAAFGKLTIAVLAAASGVGAVHFAAAPDSMLMYAGLLSFVIALFWLLQAGILMKNVYQAARRQAEMAKALNDEPPLSALRRAEQDNESDGGELPPAEIIAVQDGEEVTT